MGAQSEFMCSADLPAFIEKYHLNVENMEDTICPRDIFGSHDDADHVYNTPRAWFMERTLNPNSAVWDGAGCGLTPVSDDIPWCMIPEKKITMGGCEVCALFALSGNSV